MTQASRIRVKGFVSKKEWKQSFKLCLWKYVGEEVKLQRKLLGPISLVTKISRPVSVVRCTKSTGKELKVDI